MIYKYKFDKILTIREKEKEDALAKYHGALKEFEEAAEKLYKLLKKKEDLQKFQEEKLNKGLSVQEIRHNQSFMDNLEKLIEHSQLQVLQARERMIRQQESLMQKNMEVKKYEKMKETDFIRFLDIIKADENKNMDEISIRQFMNKDY
ncbi:flagellar export protein FliJ [Bacillus sp. MUM 13]|uniref:flagellar export protein FliJ n=1 Tax=Bacillus sp. MUM 13 TaxID=1678001 RepID=UPI0008F59C7E|nr:flagellar export protein FliJ [Bacillus sp. MUM 13]OIK15283.1 flagellar export protein FliJ [Bacillus sp. MUM 13]